MFKQIVTLFRGRAHDAAESFTDRNALPILNQQIRDSVVAVEQARRSVAVAMAQNRQEVTQHEKLVARIADLEARTIAALDLGKDDLAREAATAIAMLEAERDANEAAQKRFAADIAALRERVAAAEMKLRELKRGQRIAQATDKAQTLRHTLPGSGLNTLRDAEATLDRLRTRQQQIDLTDVALEELDGEANPARVAEKLAGAGCGEPLKTTADMVLDRLKAERAKKTK